MQAKPRVESMYIGTMPPATCCIKQSLNVHYQIPQNPNGGLTEEQVKELKELKAKLWADAPACPSLDGAPHVGISCGMRLLGHLRRMQTEAKRTEGKEHARSRIEAKQ